MNNLPKVVAQRRGRASNPRLLDRKSDALPLSYRATTVGWAITACTAVYKLLYRRFSAVALNFVLRPIDKVNGEAQILTPCKIYTP